MKASDLAGKTFCFTGIRDKELTEWIEINGGIIKSSAVKGLNYLIAKDPTGDSGKLVKAREMGTIVIGIEDMWEMVENLED